jgi:hypothetical protein
MHRTLVGARGLRRALLAVSILALAPGARALPNDALGGRAAAAAQETPRWRQLGAGPVSPGGVFCPQIAVASDGAPLLAYQDFTSAAHRLSVQRFQADAWQALATPGSGSAGDAWYDRVAFDRDGALLVAVRDYGLAGRMAVRRLPAPGAPWEFVGGGPVSPGEAHYTDVAVLADGGVVGIFEDSTTTPAYGTSVVRLMPVGWQQLGQSGLSVGYSAYQSLAVAPDGDLYAAFTDNGLGGKAVVLRYSRTVAAWVPVGAPGFTPDVPNNLALQIAPDGAPHVAYYVWNSRVVVRRWNGAAWEQVGGNVNGADLPTVETEGWRQWLSLRFDAQGRAWVAYQAANLGRRAVVKRWSADEGLWETVGEPGFTPAAADYLTLDLGPDGTPYVAYRDGNSLRAVAMAWR